MIKLICFLGNPGSEYTWTRHNAGWLLAEYLVPGVKWQKRFRGEYAKSETEMPEVHLLKPGTFMNKSGQAVQSVMSFYKIRPQEILIVHDDTELDAGKAILQAGGGTRGHNGLKSIRDCMGKNDFFRLRLGIRFPFPGEKSAFVLGRFCGDEKKIIERSYPCFSDSLWAILGDTQGMQKCPLHWQI